MKDVSLIIVPKEFLPPEDRKYWMTMTIRAFPLFEARVVLVIENADTIPREKAFYERRFRECIERNLGNLKTDLNAIYLQIIEDSPEPDADEEKALK